MGTKVGFIGSDGSDLGDKLIPKSYLIENFSDVPPSIVQPSLHATGASAQGALGNNTRTTDTIEPLKALNTTWVKGSGGGSHAAVIRSDGTLWLWGGNFAGQLGNNTVTRYSSPIQTISGGTNWKEVSCGGHYIFGHVMAIKTDGTLWGWGYNYDGQLGVNNVTHRSSPTQITGGGTNWKTVVAGRSNTYNAVTMSLNQCATAAIKTDGTLWMWGSNSDGQLGTNDVVHRSSPVQTIAGGTNWKQVSLGGKFTAAIKTDGTLWTWGTNGFGYLGDNTTVAKSSPVQTIAGGTNWKQVEASGSSCAAIKTDGTLWLWGYNYYGQLAIGSYADKSSPTQTIVGGTDWVKLYRGGLSSSIIHRADGTLMLTGSDFVSPYVFTPPVGWESATLRYFDAGFNSVSGGGGPSTLRFFDWY